jgi:pimeloyl-ACP methyl ester carboxylesterase
MQRKAMMDITLTAGPTSHYFVSLRTRLHYLDWGNRGAPVLILVHGGFDHGHSWDWTARELSRDWHVIVPDLRGHGDSAWSAEGNYVINEHVYDLAQLVALQREEQVTIVAHSLGGSIAMRYTGLFPDKVRKLVAIEGLGMLPESLNRENAKPAPERWLNWIAQRRSRADRPPVRYPSIEAAMQRMQDRNANLSADQARHLTIHGTNQNEDGSYSWKFDPYLKTSSPMGNVPEELPEFWSRITCPVLLCLGLDSWASNPIEDGRIAHFQDARLVTFENAGHWLHHDRFDQFLTELKAFI